MNVLFVSSCLSDPARCDSSQRTLQLMRQACRSHRVFALSGGSPRAEPLDRTPYEALCQELVVLPRPDGSTRRPPRLQRVAPRGDPRASPTNPALQAALDELVRREFIDLVVLGSSRLAGLVVPPGPAVVLDLDSSAPDPSDRADPGARSWLGRVRTQRRSRRVAVEQRAGLARADRITVTSARQQAQLLTADPRLSVDVVLHGVDTAACVPAPGPGNPATLLVVADTRYAGPDLAGVLPVVRALLPRLRGQLPDVRCVVAGCGVSPALAALVGPHVEVTGELDDLRPWLRKAAVVVVPQQAGGGAPVTILQALSVQRPVVCTASAAQSLDVEHGRQLLLADTPADCAAACVNLLQDRARADALAAAGRQLVEQRHAWSVVGRQALAAWNAALACPPPVRAVTERKLRSVLQ